MMTQRITGILKSGLSTFAVAWVLYQVYAVISSDLSPIERQNVHLLGAIVVIFLGDLLNGDRPLIGRLVAGVLLVAGLAATLFIGLNFVEMLERVGLATPLDLAIGTVLILVVLEGTRRSMGLVLVVLVVISLLFANLGRFVPGFFHHAGFPWERLIPSVTTYLTNGIYGSFLDISVNVILPFLVFGSLLFFLGGERLFLGLGMVTGRVLPGGAAQTAVVASAAFGSINGSPVSNVIATGQVTIPLMKSAGFRPEFAAAVEATASTGGVLMPPIMGVAAFVMSAITGIRYIDIAAAALLPALLYYFSISSTIHLHARRNGIAPGSGGPALRTVLFEGAHLLIPIVILVIMLVQGYSPGFCAATASGIVVIGAALRDLIERPRTLIDGTFLKKLVAALIDSAQLIATIAVAVAVLGVAAQALVMTGATYKVVYFAVDVGRDSPLSILLLVAAMCIVFGMGLPTTASYILIAVIAAPALTAVGVELLAAHMFILYYTMLAAITPPIGIAALVASQLARGSYFETAFLACRIALPGFLIPFFFVLAPSLLLIGEWSQTVMNFGSAAVGILMLSAAAEGYLVRRLSVVSRILLIVSGLSLIYPHVQGILIGMAGAAVVLAIELFRARHAVVPAANERTLV